MEGAIQARLDTLMAGKTVIAIAHRLSAISHMDRLVVLERGRIVEQAPMTSCCGRTVVTPPGGAASPAASSMPGR